MNNSFVMYRLPHETTYTIMRQCDGEAAQFKQKQRKVKMREMNCKWLRMSNIS